MTKLIVADASPLIVLARASQLRILPLVAGKVIVPDVVAHECTHDQNLPGARAISEAFAKGWLKPQPKTPLVEPIIAAGLDLGESMALALAVALKAPILIDERIGRQAAFAQSLRVVGSIGILLLAKKRGLIERVAPAIQDLKREGLYISPELEQEALRRAGE